MTRLTESGLRRHPAGLRLVRTAARPVAHGPAAAQNNPPLKLTASVRWPKIGARTMMRALILAISAAITVNASQPAPPRIVTIRDLRVPAERLPAGCALSPAPTIPLDGNRVRSGLWAEFPSNPWTGTDRRLIASIRQLIDGPAAVPDGPPLDAKQLSRYLGQLADGVEEAYGAVYLQSETSLITVRAIRFAASGPISSRGDAADKRDSNLGTARVAIGPIVAIVTGEGDCFQAVGVYLKSLAN